MKKLSVFAALCLAQMGIASAGFAQTTIITTTSIPQQYCREYTQTLQIGDAIQKGYGTACMQPDGSWEIQPTTQQQFGQPVPAPNITYVVRQNRVFFVPPVPFFRFVVHEGGGYHGQRFENHGRRDYRDHDDNRGHHAFQGHDENHGARDFRDRDDNRGGRDFRNPEDMRGGRDFREHREGR